MKPITRWAVALALVVATAVVVYADWSAPAQEKFYGDQYRTAEAFEDLRVGCGQLVSAWFSESVSSSIHFADHPDGVTEANMTNMITLCQALDAFLNNGVVAQADRRGVINAFTSKPSP